MPLTAKLCFWFQAKRSDSIIFATSKSSNHFSIGEKITHNFSMVSDWVGGTEQYSLPAAQQVLIGPALRQKYWTHISRRV